MTKKKAYFHTYLPYFAMVEDGIILTKDLHLLRTFSFSLKDFAYADQADIWTSVRNLNSTFRLLSYEGWTIYIDSTRKKSRHLDEYFPSQAPSEARRFDSLRRASLGEFFYNEFYITFCYKVPEKKNASSLFFSSGAKGSIREDLATFISVTDDIYGMYQSCFSKVEKMFDSKVCSA